MCGKENVNGLIRGPKGMGLNGKGRWTYLCYLHVCELDSIERSDVPGIDPLKWY